MRFTGDLWPPYKTPTLRFPLGADSWPPWIMNLCIEKGPKNSCVCVSKWIARSDGKKREGRQSGAIISHRWKGIFDMKPPPTTSPPVFPSGPARLGFFVDLILGFAPLQWRKSFLHFIGAEDRDWAGDSLEQPRHWVWWSISFSLLNCFLICASALNEFFSVSNQRAKN